MRDNIWLESRLERLLQNHFQDVDIINPIVIRFGPRTRRRIGSIKLANYQDIAEKVSEITINSYLRAENIPVEVVDATIAHELVHYLHGFNSEHNQLFDYPHLGSIVNKELRRRGLSNELIQQKKWLRENWQKIISKTVK